MVRPFAGFAVSIASNGRVVAQGTGAEVLGRDRYVLDKLEKNMEEIEATKGILNIADAHKPQSKLILAEEIEVGHVSWQSGV